MKQFFLVCVSTFLIGGCAATKSVQQVEHLPGVSPLAALSSSQYPQLKAQIDATLQDSLFPPANIGIKIVSLSTGETLYELNPMMLFTPASNEKLFTSAAALADLGKGFQFMTKVSVDSTDSLIFIKGSGDPLLSTNDLDSLARVIRSKLPSTGTWSLVGDVSYFDSLYWGEGWMWDDEQEDYNMAVSPLSVNSNVITIQIRPGKLEDAPVRVRTVPPTGYVSIVSTATTPVDTPVVPLSVTRDCLERSNRITISGQMLHRDSLSERHLSVFQPERYTLTLFAERLQSNGLKIGGIDLNTLKSGSTPLAEFSHRLDSVLTYQNKESDNLSAENVLKTLSAEKHGPPGTAQSGISLVKQFLSSIEVDTTKLVMVDGSGLSRYNLTSPDITVRLLACMYKRNDLFETFYNSLPIAGVDGTLATRMKGTSAEGNLRAKTGTLTGASSLSGYVTTADNDTLAFSILINNYASTVRAYRQVEDRIGVILGGFSRQRMR